MLAFKLDVNLVSFKGSPLRMGWVCCKCKEMKFTICMFCLQSLRLSNNPERKWCSRHMWMKLVYFVSGSEPKDVSYIHPMFPLWLKPKDYEIMYFYWWKEVEFLRAKGETLNWLQTVSKNKSLWFVTANGIHLQVTQNR